MRVARWKRYRTPALAVVALAAALSALDWAADGGSAGVADLAADFFDRLLTFGAVAAIVVILQRQAAFEADASSLRAGLVRVSGEAEDWRRRSRRLLDGLGEAIAAQFRDWGLTPAEAEIAGLMLKGVSLRDIAALRRTSEATIRQQAQGIYRKSGLANRAELAAYFLDDLFGIAEGAVPEGEDGATDLRKQPN